MNLIKSELKDNYIYIILIVILIIGCLLRFYGLEIQSLDHAELGDWHKSSFDSLKIVNMMAVNDLHPPGYPIYLHFIIKYIGDSATILRATSAVCGTISIYMIYLLAVRLYSYKEGLIAAALMSVSWFPLYYSQRGRTYSMLMLFSLISVYFWYSILQSFRANKRPSLLILLGYILSAVITSYLHYYGLYFIVLQAAAIILYHRKKSNILYIILMYASILVLYLPWLLKLLYQIPDNINMLSYIDTPHLNFFTDYIRRIFNNSEELLLVVIILYGYLLIYSLFRIYKNRFTNNISGSFSSPGLMLAIWLIGPALGAYLISITSLLSHSVTGYRHLIISLPAAYLLLARSITILPFPLLAKALLTITLIFSLLFNLIFSMDYYSKPYNAQYREAVNFIVERDHFYEKASIISYVWNPNSLKYYFNKQNMEKSIKIIAGRSEDISKVTEFIGLENPKYIWYISAHRVPEPEFVELLERELHLIEHKKFIRTQVWLFENRNYKGI